MKKIRAVSWSRCGTTKQRQMSLLSYTNVEQDSTPWHHTGAHWNNSFYVLMIWLVYLLSSLLTIVLTAGMISGEVEAGTFAVIVPKPISRTEIVIGKWLGSALILVVYTALMFFAFLAVIYWKTGYWPP